MGKLNCSSIYPVTIAEVVKSRRPIFIASVVKAVLDHTIASNKLPFRILRPTLLSIMTARVGKLRNAEWADG